MSLAHDVRHAPFEQSKSPQFGMSAVGVLLHVPLLHCFWVAVAGLLALSHELAAHAVLLGAAQVPAWHVSLTQFGTLALHSLSGSVLSATGAQRPDDPQRWHVPHMACDLSQHTPSVQYSLPEQVCSSFVGSAVVHAPPGAIFKAQLPLVPQYELLAQSASVLQPVHLLPSLLHTWPMPHAPQLWPQCVLVLHVAQLVPAQYVPATFMALPGAHAAPDEPHSHLPLPHMFT